MGLNFARTTTYRKIDHDSMVMVMNIDPTLEYKEGTPCYYDAVAKVVKPIPATSGNAATDDAIVAKYFGIAQGTNPVAHNPRKLTKMSFYIGDAVVKIFTHAGEVLTQFGGVFQGDEDGVVTTNAASRTEKLGNIVIEAEEFKVAHTTDEGEEISVLIRPSIVKTRAFA